MRTYTAGRLRCRSRADPFGAVRGPPTGYFFRHWLRLEDAARPGRFPEPSPFLRTPASGVVAGKKPKFKIDHAEPGVVVSAQDHKGPVEIGFVMNDRAEDEAGVVDEPLHSLAGEVSQRRMCGAAPIEFLPEESANGYRASPNQRAGYDEAPSLHRFRRLRCLEVDTDPAMLGT